MPRGPRLPAAGFEDAAEVTALTTAMRPTRGGTANLRGRGEAEQWDKSFDSEGVSDASRMEDKAPSEIPNFSRAERARELKRLS